MLISGLLARQPTHDISQERPNSITLSSSQTSSQVRLRAGLRPASELDSVMEFGLSVAIQLASRSAGVDLVSDLSQTGLNLAADQFAASLQPARELVCDLLASWIASDRPNAITLSSSQTSSRAG